MQQLADPEVRSIFIFVSFVNWSWFLEKIIEVIRNCQEASRVVLKPLNIVELPDNVGAREIASIIIKLGNALKVCQLMYFCSLLAFTKKINKYIFNS